MAQKEPAEGRRFPSTAGPAPKRLRGTGISAVLPARLRTESGAAMRAGSLAHLPSPAPCLCTRSARRREGHPRWFIHGGIQPSPPLLRVSRGSVPLPARPRSLSVPRKVPVLAAGGRRQLRAPPRLSAPGSAAARTGQGLRSCWQTESLDLPTPPQSIFAGWQGDSPNGLK